MDHESGAPVTAAFMVGDDNTPRFLGIFLSTDRMMAARLSLLCQAMGWDNRKLQYFQTNLNEIVDTFPLVPA